MQVVWHGSQKESFDLINAISRNCICEYGLMGRRLETCAPHKMLTEDQRALNGLLFARRTAVRLRDEEYLGKWGETCEPDEIDAEWTRFLEGEISSANAIRIETISPAGENTKELKNGVSEEEIARLAEIIQAVCQNDVDGGRCWTDPEDGLTTCSAHQNFNNPVQRNRLIWVGRRGNQFQEEEFEDGKPVMESEVGSSIFGLVSESSDVKNESHLGFIIKLFKDGRLTEFPTGLEKEKAVSVLKDLENPSVNKERAA